MTQGTLGIAPIVLEEFSKNNPDFYKEILLSPQGLGPYMPYYGSLTHQESFLISDKIYLAWQKMAAAGHAPNFLLDTARPHPWLMAVLASAKSPIHILMVTCDVEKALERSYIRGLETKRFMPTKTLLTFHQSELDMLVEAIEKYNLHVSLIDTNDALPVVAATMNFDRKFDIHHHATWENFLKSKNINVNAVNASELYIITPAATLTPSMLQPL